MSILLRNKLLRTVEDRVEAGLQPATRDNYMKIVVAGMRAGLDKGANSILASLKQSRNPVQDAAVGAINLVLMLRQQSRGTMPVQALVPAAMTLMLQALDFVDRTGTKRIGPKEVDQATHVFANHMFTVFKITPAMLQSMGAKVHAVTQNPQQMQMIARKAGVEKDPQAGQQTGPTPQLPAYRPRGLINAPGGRNAS